MLHTPVKQLTTRATVKRFDPFRGNYAASPAFWDHVLIRPSIVSHAGYEHLFIGDSVDVVAHVTPAGPVATLVVPNSLQSPHVFHDAVIKTYSEDRAFGFAMLNDGRDVFVHRSVLKTSNIEDGDLFKGAHIEIAFENRPRGLSATALRIL